MTRRDLLAPSAFLLAAALYALGVYGSGRVFLPKHPAATPPGADPVAERIVPYGAGGADSRAAAEPFNFPKTDPINLLGPDLAFTSRALSQGRLPLWNPDVLCGAPHAANPITGVFYPPTWVALLFGLRDAPLILAALHLALAAIFVYAFLRSTGIGLPAAALGGLAGALSGYAAGRMFNFVVVDVVVWIPLALCAVERILSERLRSGILLLAFSIAMMFCAGFPQLAILGVLGAGVYAAVGLAAKLVRSPRLAGKGAVSAVLGVLLGAMLASPLLLPAAELRRASERGRGAAAEAPGLRPGAFVGLCAPNVLGDPYDRPASFPPKSGPEHAAQAARHVAATLLVGAVGPDGRATVDGGTPSHSELAIYPGAIVLLLAPLGLLRRTRAAIGLLAVAFVGTAYAMRVLSPPPALAAALGLDVGSPIRGAVVFAFVPAALFAFAVDALTDPAARRFGKSLAMVLLSVGAVPGLFGAAAPTAFDSVAIDVLRRSGAERLMGLGSGGDLAAYADHLRPALDLLREDLLRFSGAALLGLTAVAAFGSRRRIAVVLFGLAVAADLGFLVHTWVRPIRAEDPYPSTPALRALEERSVGHRFARVAANEAEARADVHRLFQPNCGLIHGLKDAQGYREPAPSLTLEYFRGLSSITASAGTGGFSLAAAGSPAIDVAGVRFFLATRPLEDDPAFAASGLRRAPVTPTLPGDAVLYENPDALPPAFAVPSPAPSSRPTTRPAVVAVPVSSYRPRPEETSFTIELPAPATFVFTEAFDRGWEVSIGGGSFTPPETAFGLFLAASLPAGRSEVRFRYRPYGWHFWPAAAGLALLGVGLLGLRARARKTPTESTEATTQTPEHASEAGA